MDLQLKSRTCLVTGASTGIGRATALALAAEGARVIATARSLDALDTLPAAIQAAGGAVPVLLAADFAQGSGAERLAAAALAAVGQVDVLINNAGGSRPIGAKIGPGRDIGCEVCAFAARWRGAGEPWGVARRGWPERVGR